MTKRFSFSIVFAAVAALGFSLTVLSGSASAFDKTSGTDAQREACTADVMSYCMSMDVNVIVACLKKDPRVSKTCKAVVNASHH